MEKQKEELQKLKKKLDKIVKGLCLPEKEKKRAEIEKEMAKPNFWDDKKKAEEKTSELSDLKEEIEKIEGIRKKLEEVEVMLELKMGKEAQEKVASLSKEIKNLEIKTFLSSPYDRRNAIFSIHAGQGGTEAMDWAQMLERMYLHYMKKKGWSVDIVDVSPGEEAGIKSITMQVFGPYAYGMLRGEAGVHRLVRQSPFNADKLRQTSFALVEVLPQIEEEEEVSLDEDELEWQFFRASTQGGQNVQKVSTAVRLKHKPTGITVTSQSERYQERNREIAKALLKAKLWALKQEQMEKKKEKLKGEYKTPGWGNQIRSYILHPYKMVKDLRTGVESSNPEQVLDGELDRFIEANLRQKV